MVVVTAFGSGKRRKFRFGPVIDSTVFEKFDSLREKIDLAWTFLMLKIVEITLFPKYVLRGSQGPYMGTLKDEFKVFSR
jgi:hypothetical protein